EQFEGNEQNGRKSGPFQNFSGSDVRMMMHCNSILATGTRKSSAVCWLMPACGARTPACRIRTRANTRFFHLAPFLHTRGHAAYAAQRVMNAPGVPTSGVAARTSACASLSALRFARAALFGWWLGSRRLAVGRLHFGQRSFQRVHNVYY